MAKLSWAETYSVAKSQGLSDTQAAQSANNWAAKGGKDASTVPSGASATAYSPPTSWTTQQAREITGQTNPVGSSSAPLTISDSSSNPVAVSNAAPNTQAGGAYVSTTAKTDEERTNEAIASYKAAGLKAQEEAARLWAQKQGYNITDAPTSQISQVTQPIDLKKEEVVTNPYQGIWGDFLKEMQQYVPKPVTAATPDLSVYTQTIQNSLAPILETQLANLNAQRRKAKKDTESDLIRRGFFGQLPSVEKMNELNDIFDNTEANLRANYLSTVMDKAFPLYSQSLAQDAQSKQSYNQNMLNLGLAVMNGMVDQQKFIADDAYRKAVLARLYGQDAASMFGTVGGVQ